MKKDKVNISDIGEQNNQKNKWLIDLGVIAILFFLTMVLFRGIFDTNQMIVSTDYSLWGPKMYKETLLSGQWQKWLSFVNAGNDYQALFLYPNLILMMLLPLHFYVGWMFAFNVFLAGAFSYLLLRSFRLERYPAFFGALGFMFTTHIVSQVYPGHMGKMDMFIWTPLLFLFYTKALQDKKWIYFVSAGICYGLHFLAGEVQIAYYIGLILAIYTLWLWWGSYKENNNSSSILKTIPGLVIVLAITLLLAFNVFQYYLGLSSAGEGTNAGTSKESPASQYDFATSWSFPPEEIVTLFLQRPFGNITGDPTGNEYWGRIGSKNMVLKLNDDYVGVIPLLFAAIALITLPRRKTIFWGLLAGVSLLFAFGGYTPLYKLVYAFPAMKNFRAPTKWFFITTFSISILSALGVQWFYTRTNDESNSKKVNLIIKSLLTLCGISFLTVLIAEIFSTQITGLFKNLDYSIVLSRYQVFVKSLWKMNYILWPTAGLIYAGLKIKNWHSIRNIIVGSLACLLIIELWMSGSYFIQYFDWKDTYSASPITQYIQNDKEYPRVKLGPQNAVVANMAQMQFKYYQINLWDSPASRLPVHYQNFLDKIASKDFMKFMDTVSIKYLVSGQQIGDPMFEQVQMQPGAVLYKYANAVPHAYLISKYIKSDSDDKSLDLLAAPEFNVRNAVILNNPPSVPNTSDSGYLSNAVNFTKYSNNEIIMTANAPQDSFLVLTDYYFPDWKAYINGNETPIYRANYLVRAIRVPKGQNTVKFIYEPPMTGLYVTAYAWILILLGLGIYFVVCLKKRRIL